VDARDCWQPAARRKEVELRPGGRRAAPANGGSGGSSCGIVFAGMKPIYAVPDTTVIFGAAEPWALLEKYSWANATNGSMGAAAAEFEVK